MTAAATSMRAANRVSSRPGLMLADSQGTSVKEPATPRTPNAIPGATRNPACALMGSHAGERGDPDDEQRSGGCGARRLMQQVDQGRDRQDGPPAAERVQRQIGPFGAVRAWHRDASVADERDPGEPGHRRGPALCEPRPARAHHLARVSSRLPFPRLVPGRCGAGDT